MDSLKFVRAFKNGQISDSEFSEIIFTPHNVGELVLTSGRLVACDPLVNPDSDPFKVTLIPGRYSVILSIAHIQNNNDRRVAYAMLCLSQQTPVRWEIATSANEDEDLSSFSQEESFGYPVDSGTGCFMDADAAQIINDSIYSAKARAENWNYQIECTLKKNYSPTWDWANICVDSSTQVNVIAFHSGWGDGIYPTYFGYDAKNNIVNVITDFSL
ncbi:DUF4241 domain-containing protein [uncultured Nostoc sp.]|uniref:DUF4241 domain-containing protein n=1 Tax=uncultured Nostoc sp. TaxID=340711 RepID=UPI0035C9697F